MKRRIFTALIVLLLVFPAVSATAQCSICTKSAQQLGDKPAKGMNNAIFYLAFAPFLIIGVIGYRWYKSDRS